MGMASYSILLNTCPDCNTILAAGTINFVGYNKGKMKVHSVPCKYCVNCNMPFVKSVKIEKAEDIMNSFLMENADGTSEA
jgi:RNase P subunit RPR2